MDNSFSTVSKRIKQQAVIESLTHENETTVEIHRRLLAFYGEDTVAISTVRLCVRKSTGCGGNLNLNDQPQSGKPITGTHDLKRQKVESWIVK
jgi:hypothetical protein